MRSSDPPRPTPKIQAAMLRDFGLFEGIDDDTLSLLARELPTTHVDTGETVVHEGDNQQEMFIVIAGELEVLKRGKSGGEARVALFGPGDWFGEMSLLEVVPRSATVRAVSPTMLVRVRVEDVDNLLEKRDTKMYARFLLNIAKELSRRLRVADGIVAQLVTSVADEYVQTKKR